MAAVELWAYPVLLGAIYGVFRVGRHERSPVFHWMRLATLAALLGFVVAIQVKLILVAQVTDPMPLAAGSLSIAGVVCLVGIYIYDRSQRDRVARAETAASATTRS